MQRKAVPFAILILIGIIIVSSCQNEGSQKEKTTSLKDSLRDTVSSQAIAGYNQKVYDPLNPDWYFTVQLYETKKPLDYIVRMGFEEMEEADTVHYPDLGFPIKPAILKGPDSLTCFIGFISPDGKFNYYKSVYVEKKQLHIQTVRQYKMVQEN
jgi:predicted ester cyclase